MPDITATDAARNFADVLDAVEHRGEHFAIVRRGRTIARLEPATGGGGADFKALLRRHHRDADWREDIESVRDLLEVEERP